MTGSQPSAVFLLAFAEGYNTKPANRVGPLRVSVLQEEVFFLLSNLTSPDHDMMGKHILNMPKQAAGDTFEPGERLMLYHLTVFLCLKLFEMKGEDTKGDIEQYNMTFGE